jgi:hypothetical protein
VMGQPDASVEVLSGTADGGLRWVVVASGDDDNLSTMLHIYRGGQQLAGSGFGGPGLYPGSVVNEWRGQADDLPYFVMARIAPIVDRVIATTSRGAEIELTMSPLIDRFGVRFAVAALPHGQWLGSLRAEHEGTTLETCPQPMPRPRPYLRPLSTALPEQHCQPASHLLT